jgi:hypothetical protein
MFLYPTVIPAVRIAMCVLVPSIINYRFSISSENKITFELGYNVMRGPQYFPSLQTSVVLTEEYNVMVNSDGLIGTTEYLDAVNELSYNLMSL